MNKYKSHNIDHIAQTLAHSALERKVAGSVPHGMKSFINV